LNLLDSRFRENDKIGEITTFYEFIIIEKRELSHGLVMKWVLSLPISVSMKKES
jgi:hypothetical protein